MTRFIVAALAAAFATPALAQSVPQGNYAGTSADGNSVSLTVATDGNGVNAVTGALVWYTANCKGGSVVTNTGWGYGFDAPISGKDAAKNTTGTNNFTIALKMTFDPATSSVSGTVSTIVAVLSPVGPKPKKALYCKSPTQTFSATLQPQSARVTPQPPIQAVQLGRPIGR